MAHFYGTLKGARGEATRCGTKGSGITTTAASYSGAVRVDLSIRGGVDWAVVQLIPWQGTGTNYVLYSGPVHDPHGATTLDATQAQAQAHKLPHAKALATIAPTLFMP